MAIPEGGVYDITIIAGATYRETFSSRGDDETSVIPFPAGTTGRAEITTGDDEALLLTFTVTVDEDAGDVTVEALPTITTAMDRGGNWKLWLDVPGGDVILFVSGTARLRKP